MCFSATSSFAAAGMLSCAGLLSIARVRKPTSYAVAVIPFGFAIQQFAEGIIWQRYGYADDVILVQTMIYIFLMFAFAVWPIWIPFALWLREDNAQCKKLLFYFVLWGLVMAGYAGYILGFQTIQIRIVNHSIAYILGDQYTTAELAYLFGYVVATVVPFFISSKKLYWLCGVLLAGTLVLSHIVWSVALISVWCFFAAVLSMLVLLGVSK